MKRIITVGESTFDVIFKDNKPVEAKAGGAMLNQSISLSRLGLKVCFVSALGNDKVGKLIAEFLTSNKVSLEYVGIYPGVTRLALAFLDANNSADFSFYNPQNQTANFNLPVPDIDDYVMVGSSLSIRSDIRERLLTFFGQAKNSVIIYDPNFRTSYREQRKELLPVVEENFSFAHIIKGSTQDFFNLYDCNNITEIAEHIRKLSSAILVITAEDKDVHIFTSSDHFVQPVAPLTPISAIGAGDAFSAGMLFGLFKVGATKSTLPLLDKQTWHKIIAIGIACAQHVCMSYNNYLDEKFARGIVESYDATMAS